MNIEKLNEVIKIDNEKRKNYRGAIRLVSSRDYIAFHALLIGSTSYSEIGENMGK